MNFSYWVGWLALLMVSGAVLFWLGHWFGRREESEPGEARHRLETATYYRGLNFVLSQETDKAIEEFVKIARVDSDTVEVYLSLGNLFRSRGEVGRAIRIHQTLIARPQLPVEMRIAALYAIAMDYRQGGFVDRAVDAYQQVLAVSPDHRQALAGLQSLWENEGRWEQALQILERLEQVSGQPDPRRKAHLLVLMAAESLRGGVAVDLALERLQAAIRIFPGCVEAYRLLGEHLVQTGQPERAIGWLLELRRHRPSHLVLVLGTLERAFAQRGDDDGFMVCMTEVVRSPKASSALLVYWSNWLALRDREGEGVRMLQEGWAHRPEAVGIARELIRRLRQQGRLDEVVEVAERCLDHLLARQQVYQCSRCGYKSREIHWKCPQCHQWDTVEPL